MSKYAKIENNIVTNVIICEDSYIGTQPGHHVKVTDFTNEPIIGFEYDYNKNKFKSPQPYESWTLNEETLVWESPDGPKPTNGFYRWDEETNKWVELG